MINHTVLFKLKEFDSEQEKSEAVTFVKEQLESLDGKIDELKYIEVQRHLTANSPSFDIALITHFESVEAIDIYQVHPEHVKVVGEIKPLFAGRACVDFEM